MNSGKGEKCDLKEQIKRLINDNKPDKAGELLEEYELSCPDDVEIFSIRAVILILSGKLDEAENVLLKGYSVDPDNFDINYNLGYLYEQRQKYNLAVKYYLRAHYLCSDNKLKENIKSLVKRCKYNHEVGMLSRNSTIRKVLFIQSVPDIRTYKIAKVLRNRNIQVDIMYLLMHPSEVYKGLKLPYDNYIRLQEVNKIVDFINNSDYDILVSCNEPDFFSALLTVSNKPLIHDCHDMMSLRGNISNDQIVVEYLANSKSDGNIYVTELVKKIAENKFQIANKPVMILDNYILKEQLPDKFLSKLSEKDNEIHCVYEGGLTNIENHHRNIQDFFLKLAENKIHVHYYATFENRYYRALAEKSEYLHCEDTKGPLELITDMTKYDIGLAILNVTDRNKTFLDTTFPNKVWDYLAAGLPVLCSDLLSFRNFLAQHNVGAIIDFSGDLAEQVKRVLEISIQENYLAANKLCMDDYADDIIAFTEIVKQSKN